MKKYSPELLVAFVVVMIMVAASLWGCGTTVVPTDHVALRYGGGPLDNREYRGQMQPGTGFTWKGWMDGNFQYPMNQRTYVFSERPDEGDVQGADVLEVNAKDGNAVKIQGAVYFHLVNNEKTLKEFHEKFGLRYNAYNDHKQEWGKLLEAYIRQPIKDSLQTEVANYTVIESIEQTGKAEISAGVNDVMQKSVDSAMGGHYFEVTSFKLTAIRPSSDDIKNSIAKVVQNQQLVLAAEQEYQAKLKVAKGNEAIKNSLQGNGGMAAVIQDAAKNGNVKLIIVPANLAQNLNIDSGGQ